MWYIWHGEWHVWLGSGITLLILEYISSIENINTSTHLYFFVSRWWSTYQNESILFSMQEGFFFLCTSFPSQDHYFTYRLLGCIQSLRESIDFQELCIFKPAQPFSRQHQTWVKSAVCLPALWSHEMSQREHFSLFLARKLCLYLLLNKMSWEIHGLEADTVYSCASSTVWCGAVLSFWCCLVLVF